VPLATRGTRSRCVRPVPPPWDGAPASDAPASPRARRPRSHGQCQPPLTPETLEGVDLVLFLDPSDMARGVEGARPRSRRVDYGLAISDFRRRPARRSRSLTAARPRVSRGLSRRIEAHVERVVPYVQAELREASRPRAVLPSTPSKGARNGPAAIRKPSWMNGQWVAWEMRRSTSSRTFMHYGFVVFEGIPLLQASRGPPCSGSRAHPPPRRLGEDLPHGVPLLPEQISRVCLE
jgi:hypothetical protein